ncbi:MAG: hypothetical protein EPN21_15690 [Methylococcaceae bacterium]|nr:MAG: hypothetical protein EPN21_15690 [Methylococcaceae bacterium]
MPELRIIDQSLWDTVQTRLHLQTKRSEAIRQALHDKARAGAPLRHLFSGLLKCAACGSPFVTVGNNRYGCSGHKYRGAAVCPVATTVKRSIVESKLLEGIKHDINNKEAQELFARETRKLLQAEAARTKPDMDNWRHELAVEQTKIDNMVTAIAKGTFSPALQAALETAESRKLEITQQIQAAEQTQRTTLPDFLPRAADIYAELIRKLEETLNADVDIARECLRGIVGDEILIRRATDGECLEAQIKADYLKQAAGCTLSVVAGTGFEPMTFGL